MLKFFNIGGAVILAVAVSSCKTVSNSGEAELKDITSSNQLSRTELGTIGFDQVSGKSSSLQINVPSDALSMTVFVADPDAKDNFLITDVLDPDGTAAVISRSSSLADLVRDGEFGRSELLSPNRSTLFDVGFASLTVPSNSRVNLKSGTWSFKVLGVEVTETGATASRRRPTVEVFIKRGEIGASTRGKLEVNLFFSGGNGISKATYETNTSFTDLWRLFSGIYADAGIDVLVNTVSDLPSGTPKSVRSTDELQRAFKATTRNAAVNLLFFETIDLDFGTVAGFSGGLPGRPFAGGTSYAGVAVVTKPVGEFERRAPAGIVLAHELGHYLGLPHTFEGFGIPGPAEADQLDDTPTDFSKNVMDFGANPFPAESTNLTTDQRQVLLRSPAVVLE